MIKHIVKLFTKQTNEPRCDKCQGIGMVLKNTQNVSNIPKCPCTSDLPCYKCENNKFKGLYEECETCWGSGKKSELLLNED